MKKYFLSLGLIVAATFTLTNCTEQIDAPVESVKTPFEIIASTAETKTANNDLKTVWTEDDALNVFHVVSGKTEYVNDGKFTLSGENVFSGELTGTLEEDVVYNWYASYPYSSSVQTPASTSYGYLTVGSGAKSSQQQVGYNSMSHIAGKNYPLAGVLDEVEYVSGDPINITMSHLTALLEVVVTNKNDEPLTVESVAFTGTENIVGTYFIDYTTDPVVFTKSGDSYVSKVANLSVSNGTEIAKDGSAKFYLAVKPFTAAAASKLRLAVNGYSKQITLENPVTFSAGKIKTLNFAYDEVKLPLQSIPWSEDFTAPDMTKYKLVHGSSDTKLYEEDRLAGGVAPELLIGKNNGSMTVSFSAEGYAGKKLSLLFKTNKTDCLEVSATDGVEVEKVSATEFTVNVLDGTEEFSLTIQNTNASTNARVDDIELDLYRTAQTISFEESSVSFIKGSSDYNSFAGQTVSGNKTPVTYSSSDETVATVNAETGAVTLQNKAGVAKITATAAKTAEYRTAIATYTITVSDPISGGRADIETLEANSSYGTYTTTAGWIGTNCAVFKGGSQNSAPTYSYIADTDAVKAFCMNGKTSAVGTIASPLLSGGCGTLTFNYAYFYSESNGVKFKVEVIQNDEVVKTITVDNASLVQNDVVLFSEDVNVAGEFKLLFTNLSPSAANKNKDRYAIWNIAWTPSN